MLCRAAISQNRLPLQAHTASRTSLNAGGDNAIMQLLPGPAIHKRDGPLPSQIQTLGGIPSESPDTNLSIALLFLYTAAGLMHFGVLIYNKKHHHKFLINGLVFGFAKIRIIAYALRDAWASHPDNLSLGLASTIFITAGSFLLLAANLVMTQRIVRAQHPDFGWSKPASIALPAIIAFTVLAVIALVVAGIQLPLTDDEYIHYVDHILILVGSTSLSFISILPALLVLLSSSIGLLPKVQINRTLRPVDKFGRGRMRHNVMIVAASAVILTIGAVFKTVTAYLPAVPVDVPGSQPPIPADTPWYLSKAAFYAFNPLPELIVMFMWLFVRIDIRFHVPNHARGSYITPPTEDTEVTDGESVQEKRKSWGHSVRTRNSVAHSLATRNSTHASEATRVPDGADSTVVLDAFFGGPGGSPETVGGEDRVAGQAAYAIQDTLHSVMQQWQLEREFRNREVGDYHAISTDDERASGIASPADRATTTDRTLKSEPSIPDLDLDSVFSRDFADPAPPSPTLSGFRAERLVGQRASMTGMISEYDEAASSRPVSFAGIHRAPSSIHSFRFAPRSSRRAPGPNVSRTRYESLEELAGKRDLYVL